MRAEATDVVIVDCSNGDDNAIVVSGMDEMERLLGRLGEEKTGKVCRLEVDFPLGRRQLNKTLLGLFNGEVSGKFTGLKQVTVGSMGGYRGMNVAEVNAMRGAASVLPRLPVVLYDKENTLVRFVKDGVEMCEGEEKLDLKEMSKKFYALIVTTTKARRQLKEAVAKGAVAKRAHKKAVKAAEAAEAVLLAALVAAVNVAQD